MTINYEGGIALEGRAELKGPEGSDSSMAIRDWLVAKLAEGLRVSPQEIDLDEPLTSYGLGSIQALTLVADLEDLLARDLPPTLLWDCSTLNELIRYLTLGLAPGSA